MSWKFTKESRLDAPVIKKQKLRGITGFVGAASLLVDIYEQCLKGHIHQPTANEASLKSRKCGRCGFIWHSDEPIDEQVELDAISGAMMSCVTKMVSEGDIALTAIPKQYISGDDLPVIGSFIAIQEGVGQVQEMIKATDKNGIIGKVLVESKAKRTILAPLSKQPTVAIDEKEKQKLFAQMLQPACLGRRITGLIDRDLGLRAAFTAFCAEKAKDVKYKEFVENLSNVTFASDKKKKEE